ncbi:ATP-binding cassette domain-containing protein [Oceanobacillus sp. J11TS1]|uniref:ATP-binding cassette domain-containing protein n=1 Tax=Oceanobacillus sp. J11TS1 TaxID=2807191 RepID=UPI001B11BF45|nr:ATP-binding cassette domain-containing protein [Oceanobacillus sp. J11TS1]GIO23069.1 aliphatic sulfonates import ATP-binding protein SsuB 3 [Oceanobacillus sp. J11TS1]
MSGEISGNSDNVKQLTHQAVQIDVEQGSKSFGEKQVLKDINLSIEKGQFVAIIGQSGSGKSTFLRLAAGLDELTKGKLLYNQTSLDQSTINVTMMYQDSRLLPWKSVIDNVNLGLETKGEKRAEQVLDAVGLLEHKDKWPAQLSGGQQQRVALARALIHEPSLLLLDEPLSALDAFTRLEMQNLIEEIWSKLGFTTLLVTHDVREAIRLADRIILIEDGSVAMDLEIDHPRPRQLSDTKLVVLEEQILNRIMNGEVDESLKEKLSI